jgi:uncharacterized protein DUF3826
MFRSVIGTCQILILSETLLCTAGQAWAANSNEAQTAYAREITKRADKIVAPLEISDDVARTRVRDLVARQYRSLREIHDARDATIADAKKSPSSDPAAPEASIKAARDAANLKLIDAHRRFVARLSVEIEPNQVNKVKDGMTYSVVPITYKRYMELLPALNDEQKREILANLVEARECAMDAGSSEEKHALFGKYKGRINNYLSAAGFDMKKAEQELAAKQKTTPRSR